ncbi:hypothetical protein RNJ44_04391 [Nakaseomyces bracarensis]|uniref:Cytoplasmic tRNA 2-thiolation protein 2 n=1 Tax=Nakaseomyces bracarensis TaxID=273131 RepID=A0ABR4NUT0_9SACH
MKMSGDICQRCKKEEAIIISRKETFCAECFKHFVMQKQRKQMMSDDYFREIFKVMYKDRIRSSEEAELQNKNSTILVPLSLGSSSLMLLDIVHLTLLEQRAQHKKTGFNVDVLICYKEGDEKSFQQIVTAVKELSESRFKENRDEIRFHLLSLDNFFKLNSEELHRIVLHNVDFTGKIDSLSEADPQALNLETILASCPNRSTREDLLTFITTHLVKKYAYQHGQKAILWGHSMTRLADEIISYVVKGRGSQIASSLNSTDFDEDYGKSFKNLYPLKDILLAEVDAYCATFGLNKFLINYDLLNNLLISKPEKKQVGGSTRLVKNMTINELARKYFNDIEGEYSNIIATVLRTGDKLAEPTAPDGVRKCAVCKSKIYDDVSKWLRDITVNVPHPVETELEKELYDKWSTSQIGIEASAYYKLRDSTWSHGSDADLCYGCIVTMQGVKNMNLTWPKNNEKELENILNEYSLE